VLTGRRIVGAVLVLALAAGLLALGWTWRHPHAFSDAGGWGMGGEEHRIGETLYVGMSYPAERDGGRVELLDGQVNFSRGAEVADAELLVCTLDPAAKVGAIGSTRGEDVLDYCTDLDPIDGRQLDLHYAPMRQQVLLALTLTARGTAVVQDISLTYKDGWRRGTQRTGGEVWMSSGTLPRDYYG
jgi:hypothetical protein